MPAVVTGATVRAVEQTSFISNTGNIIQPYRTTSSSIESISTWNGTCGSMEYGYLTNWILPWTCYRSVKQQWVDHSPKEGYPNCLHTTSASLLSQLLSQTVPHLPSTQISTLPCRTVEPRPLNRMEPSLHSLPNARLKIRGLHYSFSVATCVIKKLTYINMCMKLSNTYHCISLQHHHHGHSLNYTVLLHHNWHSLTALFLPHYIQHCPRVWVHFPDQSGRCCMQLLL